MRAKWVISLVLLIGAGGWLPTAVYQRGTAAESSSQATTVTAEPAGRTGGIPDDWEGAPDNYKDLYLTVSAPRSLQLRPNQAIPLTFTLRNQGTETAYLTFSCGVRLTNAEGYLMLPVGPVPEPNDPGVYMGVDGERVHVVPVAELKPDEELGETLDDAIERYHPLPAGTYTLVPVASLRMYDQGSVIIRPEEEGWGYKTWAQPRLATSRFELATEPITIVIQAAGAALPQLGKLPEAPEKAIRIELVMEKRTFLGGELIPVTIKMTNVSDTTLITDQPFKQGTERIDKFCYVIYVRDSAGDRLSPMYPTDAPRPPDGRPEVIGPDWTRSVSLLDLREHFRLLNKAGTYTVQVRFGLCLYEGIRADGSIPWQSPSWSGVIESNKLTFTILEKRAESQVRGSANLRTGVAVIVGNRDFRGKISNASGRLLVGACELGRLLGAEVIWYGGTQQVEVSSATHALVMCPGSKQGILNGKSIRLPVPPLVMGGEALVPLRFVAETFGRRVTWDARARIARVR